MPNKTIQVFEHEWLHIGREYGEDRVVFTQEHYTQLSKWISINSRYEWYTIFYNKVKFANYVGVIKISDLTIEILPKTDRHPLSKKVWQKTLLDMLVISLQVPAQTSTQAHLETKSYNVLEAYIQIFLDEVEALMHAGLVKKYRNTSSNSSALKGRLLLQKHLTTNLLHKERFYVSYQVFDRDNIYNRILHEALHLVKELKTSMHISAHADRLLTGFPPCSPLAVNKSLFDKIQFDRKTTNYKKAIELAKMVLLNYHPDLRGGSNHVFAIMIDMNLLWEVFIARMLVRAAPNFAASVLLQDSKPYWQHPDGWMLKQQPDIIVVKDKKTVVLDTKWKYQNSISAADVRQMDVYGNLWTATKRFLVYPDNVQPSVILKSGLFYDVIEDKPTDKNTCGLLLVNLFDKGEKLNWNIGSDILNEI